MDDLSALCPVHPVLVHIEFPACVLCDVFDKLDLVGEPLSKPNLCRMGLGLCGDGGLVERKILELRPDARGLLCGSLTARTDLFPCQCPDVRWLQVDPRRPTGGQRPNSPPSQSFGEDTFNFPGRDQQPFPESKGLESAVR